MEVSDVKYFEEQMKAQFNIQIAEITRLHNNQDRLLKCLEDIIVFAKKHKDFIITGLIEDCLNELELAK